MILVRNIKNTVLLILCFFSIYTINAITYDAGSPGLDDQDSLPTEPIKLVLDDADIAGNPQDMGYYPPHTAENSGASNDLEKDQQRIQNIDHAYKASRVAGIFHSDYMRYPAQYWINLFTPPEQVLTSDPVQSSCRSLTEIQNILEDVYFGRIIEAHHKLMHFSFNRSVPNQIGRNFQPVLDQLKLVLYHKDGTLKQFREIDSRKLAYVVNSFNNALRYITRERDIPFFFINTSEKLKDVKLKDRKSVYKFSDYFKQSKVVEFNKAIAENPTNNTINQIYSLLQQKKFDDAMALGDATGIFNKYYESRILVEESKKFYAAQSQKTSQTKHDSPALIQSKSTVQQDSTPEHREQPTKNISIEKSQQHIDRLSKFYQKQSSNQMVPATLIGLWEDRINVMKEMTAFGQQFVSKKYELNHEATELLKSHGIDSSKFTTLYGNQIQQCLQRELIVFINHLAHMKQNECNYQAYRLLEIAQAWQFFNKQGNLTLTTVSADYCWAVYDGYQKFGNQMFSPEYTQALNLAFHKLLSTELFVAKKYITGDLAPIIAKGTIQAVENVAHSIVHLDQTVKNIGKALGTVAWFGVRLLSLPDPESQNYGLIGNSNSSKQIEESIINDVYDFQMALFNKLNSMTEQEIAEGAIATALEFIITDKAIHKVGALAKQVPTMVKNSELLAFSEQVAESVRNMGRSLGEGESLIVAAEGNRLAVFDQGAKATAGELIPIRSKKTELCFS